MERYHSFKLGLAILFYAAYCIRPMLTKQKDTTKITENDAFFYQGVKGTPGIDFPVLSHIPRTSFTCRNVESGYYADLETDCQVFHICEDNKKISFLCPNGTIFQQGELICEWWFKVNCTNAPTLYEESAEQLREDIVRRKSSRRVVPNHGAVMRTEEKSTISKKVNNKPRPFKVVRKPVQFQKEGVDSGTRKSTKPVAIHFNNFHESFEEPSTIEPKTFSEQHQNTKSYVQSTSFYTKSVPSSTGFSRNDLNDSDEAQITQETASFYKNSFNKLENRDKSTLHPNHRQTYSEIKEPQYYSGKVFQAISSVTPHYLTTQAINKGRPFVGSQVGTTFKTSGTTPVPELFNVGNTQKILHPIVTTATSIVPDVTVPPQGSFNIGTTSRTTNYATIYGKVPTTSAPRFTISLSKSVFGTPSTHSTSSEILTAADSINYGDPKVRFFGKVEQQNQKQRTFKTSTTISSLVPPSTVVPDLVPLVSTPQLNGDPRVRHFDRTSTTISNLVVPQSNGFFVTKSSEVVRPRPFQLSSDSGTDKYQSGTKAIIEGTYPPYQISSAKPFAEASSPVPTQPTPFTTVPPNFENVDNMINTLVEMAAFNISERPGLVVPPSVGPQTLHSLAQYFANALDGISNEEEKDEGTMTKTELEKKRLTELLTQMTMARYQELFEESTTTGTTILNSDEILETENSQAPVPKVRQLAKVFTQALSSYLDDPDTFRKVLQEVRPTEPPNSEDDTDDELLNFSDADSKAPFYPTLPSVRPTWGYLLAYNGSTNDVKNSIQTESENLEEADSQSFVSQFNKLQKDDSGTRSSTQLPENHWTTSPNVGTLWKSAFTFNPASINDNFGTTEATISTEEVPDHEIKYELKSLPHIELNSTQVHGILIDFMNTTKNDTNRLQRILSKLNTTQDEFLEKMKEIEGNPLTRRLVLLLINECGGKSGGESLQTASTGDHRVASVNSDLGLIDPSLADDNQDARALQLLNSLYSIASRFGK